MERFVLKRNGEKVGVAFRYRQFSGLPGWWIRVNDGIDQGPFKTKEAALFVLRSKA
jgi:hypothetical protein